MDRITKIFQETQHRFLNLFCMDVRHRNGEASEYYVASRAKSADDLKAVVEAPQPMPLGLTVLVLLPVAPMFHLLSAPLAITSRF